MDGPAAVAQGLKATKGPAWREAFAKMEPSLAARRLLRRYDDMVWRAHHYFSLCRQHSDAVQAAAAIYPDIAAADALERNETRSERAKILTLANCDRSEVAQWVGLPEAHVKTWEELFFDARDVLGAVGWVNGRIIQRASNEGKAGFASRLRSAWLFGPAVARAILKVDSGAQVDEGERLFHRQLKFQLKLDEAMNTPIESDRSLVKFLKISSDVILKKERLKQAEQKFQARCQEVLQAHELKKMKLAAFAERERQRSEERREWQQQRAAMTQSRRRDRNEETRRLKALDEAEREAARERATASPLSRLTWYSSSASQTGSEAQTDCRPPAPERVPSKESASEKPTIVDQNRHSYPMCGVAAS